jgi:RNA polymerase sigma factor (TIGR02999 family)
MSSGRQDAVNELLPMVYAELRGLADRFLRRESKDRTIQATALVHEAYLKLVGQTEVTWQNRAHLFAVAAQAMRRILVDQARGRKRQKRGGGMGRMPLDQALLISADDAFDLVSLDEALCELGREHDRKAMVVEMRFFGGLTLEEIAEVLGVTRRTIERDWCYARAWLYRSLSEIDGASVPEEPASENASCESSDEPTG